MEIPLSLKNFARLLKLQREQGSVLYTLLLNSTISLTPDVIKQYSISGSWTNFSSHIYKRNIERSDLIDFLTEQIGIHNNVEGYRALARLIKEGYFSTILTTNLDSTLEDMLLETGLLPTALQVLIPGVDKDETIAKALNGYQSNICIIKLHGSLRERILSQHFPYFPKPPVMVRGSLERVLNQDILIVGSAKQDEDLTQIMTANQNSHIFYALPRKSLNDHIIKLIEARRNTSHKTSLISGRYGEFTTFFQALEAILLSNETAQDTTRPATLISSPYTKHIVTYHKTPLADILLVTATKVEAKAILDLCPENKQCFIGKRTYYDLGIIGGARIFMAQSEMGSDGLGGSRFTVDDGINALSPSAVIMVGIAFGLNEEEHHLGDILVSRQLLAYDNQRIGRSPDGKTAIRLRGDRVSAPTWLLDRFNAGSNTWLSPIDVHFGLFLSGSKLIANQEFRDQLRQIESEAIGGEMEGVGLYEATQRHNVGWLLIKAICDWADSNKSRDKKKRQKDAAENAARFTLHVIQQGGFRNSHLEQTIHTEM